MAKKHSNEIAVGVTVLVALLLAVYVVVVLGDWQNLLTDKQRITVKVPYKVGLKGLAQGSPVFLGGAKIGQICQTSIAKKESDPNIYVYFTLEIPSEYTLRDDCVLAPISNVLGGQSSLAIKDVGHGNILADGDVLVLPEQQEEQEEEPGTEEKVTVTFEPTITDAIDNLKDQLNTDNKHSLMRQIKDLVAKIDDQVTVDKDRQSFMAKLHKIMDRLDGIAAAVDTQLDEANAEAIVAKMHQALAKLDNSLAEVEDLIKSNKPDISTAITAVKNTVVQIEKETPEILAAIKKALDKITPAVEKTEVLISELKDAVAVNRPVIDQLILNLHEISTNLKLSSSEIRRAPWKLLYQPKKGEVQIQGLIDSAGAFATGAERLDSTSLRLQALLSEDAERTPEDLQRIQNILAELETSFEQFRKAEEKFWKEIE